MKPTTHTDGISDPEEALDVSSVAVEILNVLHEPKTEAEIIDETGHSPAAVNRHKRRLSDMGAIREVGKRTPGADPRKSATLWLRTVDEVTIEFDGERERPELGLAYGAEVQSD